MSEQLKQELEADTDRLETEGQRQDADAYMGRKDSFIH